MLNGKLNLMEGLHHCHQVKLIQVTVWSLITLKRVKVVDKAIGINVKINSKLNDYFKTKYIVLN